MTSPDSQNLARLLAQAGIDVLASHGSTDRPITHVTDDSRQVRPGGCFVAIRGRGCDGHRFIDAAIASGATAVVVDQPTSTTDSCVCLMVNNAREALARLSAAFFGLTEASPEAAAMRLIGITGTNGKTTVAWLIRSMLHEAGSRPALLGTIEYDLLSRKVPAPLTTPGPVDLCGYLGSAREAGATHAVIEVSSHALDQHRCAGLAFSAGVFTNLSGDHLDYHETMSAYGAAKQRLFASLGSQAVAIINSDDPAGKEMANVTEARCISYGISTDTADFRGRIRSMDARRTTLTLKGPSLAFDVRLSLVGRHNVLNALGAAATAWAIGVPPDAIVAGLERCAGVPGRLQRVEPAGCGFSVFVDYAHTDHALTNVLDALRPITTGRLLCVFGCGGDRDRAKRPRMAAAVANGADVAFVTSDNPRSEDPQAIIEEMLPGFAGADPCRMEVDADRRSAIATAIAQARPGDTVLIAGKGHEDYQLVGNEVRPFDDVAVARQCLGVAPTAGVGA